MISIINLQPITVARPNNSESVRREQIADLTLAGHYYGLHTKAFFTEEAKDRPISPSVGQHAFTEVTRDMKSNPSTKSVSHKNQQNSFVLILQI